MSADYPRDLIGYGNNPPHPHWPGDARIALSGARCEAKLDGAPVPHDSAIDVRSGQTLAVGAVAKDAEGLRAYLALAGGIDVPEVLGSRATFDLGVFGGHAGRTLRTGDVLPLAAPAGAVASVPAAVDLAAHRLAVQAAEEVHALRHSVALRLPLELGAVLGRTVTGQAQLDPQTVALAAGESVHQDVHALALPQGRGAEHAQRRRVGPQLAARGSRRHVRVATAAEIDAFLGTTGSVSAGNPPSTKRCLRKRLGTSIGPSPVSERNSFQADSRAARRKPLPRSPRARSRSSF